MGLVSYIFTNKLTKWGFFWRIFLIIFLPLFIATLVAAFWFRSAATPERLSQVLSGVDYKTELSGMQLLKDNEFISLSASGIQTNKSGAFFEDETFILQTMMSGTCEDAFNSTYQDGITLTKNAVCIRNNSKQQIFTVDQILSARKSIQQSITQENNAQVAQILAPYTGLSSLIQGDTLYIDTTGLQVLFTQELPQLFNDPAFQTSVLSLAKTVSMFLILPLILILVIIVVFVVLIYLLIFIVYSWITQIIFRLMKSPISFDKAFSITWLPLIVVIILTDWIFHLSWWYDMLIFIILIIGLIKLYKNEKGSEGSETNNLS